MKWLFRIVTGALLLVVLAVAGILLFVDPNDYKPQIEQQVEQATGRQLSIGGEIGLSLLPLGLELSNVELANARGFDDPYFARIDSLVIKVKLLPLIKQELAIDALSLDGLSVFLQVKANGENNWQDLSSSSTVADNDTTDDAASPAADQRGAQSPLAALAVNGIEIRNAQVQFNDQSSDQLIQLSQLNLTTGDIRFDQPFELELGANVGQRQAGQQNAADIRLKTAITIARSLQQFALDDIQLAIKAKLPALQPEPVSVSLRADSRIDLAAQRVELRDAEIDAMYTTLKLQATIADWQNSLRISGKLQTADIQPKDLLQKLAIEPPAMQSPEALSRAKLGAQFDLRDNRLALKPLELVFDSSQLKGEADINLASMAIRYQLQLDKLNVDDYLPPPPPESQTVELAQTQNEAAKAEPEQDLPIPFDALATLDVQGRFGIGRLQVAGLDISELNINSKARNGVITLSPVSLKVLEGAITADATIDTRKRQLKVKQTLKAENLQIADIANPIVAALIPDQKVDMRGTGRLYADVSTQGLRISALQKALNGKAGFEFDDIDANGLDIEFLARGVIADYLESKKLEVKPEWRGSYQPKNVTAFDVVKADFVIRNGVATTDNFVMDSKRIDVTGKGSINIPEQTLDMVTVTDLTPRQLKTTAEKVLDEPLPVRVYGPWAAPQVDVDTGPMKAVVARLVKQKVKAKAREKVETKKQQLRDKTRDKLKNKLKNLFR